MKNIHVISTDKLSRLYLGNNGNFVFGMVQTSIQSRNSDFTNQNIYITSDEEITGFENNIWVIKGERIFLWQNMMALVSNNKPKKIILTTDQDLIKDGVQAIPDEFLEWFVKNPSCEEVKIESWQTKGEWDLDYKIIIPKEEPTCWDCKGTISKEGICFCNREGEELMTHIEQKEEPKQETLEEAAREYWRRGQFGLEKAADTETAFLRGAKWQQEQFKNESTANYIDRHIVEALVETVNQERRYSEEDVKKLIIDFLFEKGIGREVENVEEWFEQYKKK